MPQRFGIAAIFVCIAVSVAAQAPPGCESDIALSLVEGHPGLVRIQEVYNSGTISQLGMVTVDWRGSRTSFIPVLNPHEIQLDLSCLLSSAEVTVTPSKCAVVGEPQSLAIPPPDTQPVLDVKTTPPLHRQVEIDYTMPNAVLQRRIRGVFLKTNDIIIDREAPGTEDSGDMAAQILGDVGPVLIKAISCESKIAVATVDTGGDKDCDCPKCDAPKPCSGDPVNTASQNMKYEDVDPLPGFALKRVYDSRTNEAGFFGPRWFSPFDANVRIFDDFDGRRYVTIFAPDRSWMVFEGIGGVYHQIGPGRARDARLSSLSGGQWRQTLPGGREARDFAADGHLIAIRDLRTGRETRFVWNGGLPTRVEDSWGNWALDVTTDATAHRITAIAPPARPDLTWHYSLDYHLATVESPLGTWRTYEYDMPGYPADRYRLTVARDAAGKIIETHGYDDDSGRANSSFGPSAEIESIAFGQGRSGNETSTTIRYKNQRTEVHYARPIVGKWRTVEVTDGCASCGQQILTVVYDGYGNVIRSQSADGYITT